VIGASARPPLITAAGILLFVVGVLGMLGGLSLMFARARDLASLSSTTFANLNLARMARGIGLIAIVLGALEILAGVLVLRRSNGGRILGIVLSTLGLVGGLGAIAGGGGSAIPVLLINGFVIYVLFSFGHVFDRTHGG
jgi:hypothetical protein